MNTITKLIIIGVIVVIIVASLFQIQPVNKFSTSVSNSTSDPDIIWSGDAESGDLSQWCNVNEAVKGRITVVDSPVAQGNHAYRFQLNNGDSIFGTERVTLSQQCEGRYEIDGQEKYYGWAVMLPNEYPFNTSWSLVVQWKGIHTGSPPIQLSQTSGNWQLTYRPTASSSNTVKWKTPVNKGQYEKFVMHVKWSTDPTVGFIELWYNGKLVVPKFYTSTIHLDGGVPVKNYVAMGLYRDATISTDVILYHDAFTVGRTFASVTGGGTIPVVTNTPIKSATPSPIVSRTPTKTLVPVSPTQTQTSTLTVTSTATKTSTATQTNTPSVTPSATASQTLTPTATLDITPWACTFEPTRFECHIP